MQASVGCEIAKSVPRSAPFVHPASSPPTQPWRDGLTPTWPEEYWPARDATATPEQFALTVEGFRSDCTALHELVADPATDLLTTIPNTPGHTILREVRLVGDHNAYHVGEFAILRQVIGTWPPGREE